MIDRLTSIFKLGWASLQEILRIWQQDPAKHQSSTRRNQGHCGSDCTTTSERTKSRQGVSAGKREIDVHLWTLTFWTQQWSFGRWFSYSIGRFLGSNPWFSRVYNIFLFQAFCTDWKETWNETWNDERMIFSVFEKDSFTFMMDRAVFSSQSLGPRSTKAGIKEEEIGRKRFVIKPYS